LLGSPLVSFPCSLSSLCSHPLYDFSLLLEVKNLSQSRCGGPHL
jgi:hypothetical protein